MHLTNVFCLTLTVTVSVIRWVGYKFDVGKQLRQICLKLLCHQCFYVELW